MDFVVVTTADGKAFRRDLDLPRMGIGRSSKNDLVISDLSLSRVHAEIYAQGSDYLVRDAGSKNGPDDLRGDVGCHVFRIAPSPDPHPEGHRRIVMAPRDMAAGKDHDHERGADGQGRDNPSPAADDRATNGENQEEGSDQFSDVFIHELALDGMADFVG